MVRTSYERRAKNLYITAMLGAVICFIGDNLLGAYVPAADFGNKLMCISFSYEWADVHPYIFAAAGACGVISLLMMSAGFYGIYLHMKKAGSVLAKPFLLSAFVFVSVGILYHNVFAIAAYAYNRLADLGIEEAESFSLELFNVFIIVSLPAAVGYAVMTILMFISAYKGEILQKRICWINPLIFMIICIILSKLLPQTAFVNGVFGFGQQSIGFFIVFTAMYITSKKSSGNKNILH